MKKIAFAPIVNKNSRVLLLGTMPSEESIRKQQYYGHKSNQFWKIIFSLFNSPFSLDYAVRVALLLDQGIALWDVLSACEGEGSADSNIKNEESNDFNEFFDKYPAITHVFFTSKKAEEFYKKYIRLVNNKIYATLPSPSPANAAMPLNRKIEKWEILRETLNINTRNSPIW